MEQQTTEKTIAGDWLRVMLTESLAAWPSVKPDEIELAIVSAEASRDRLLSLLAEIDDPGDLSMTIAIHYIELKTQWIALNTRINYAMFRNGVVSTDDALLATALSTLLMRLEEIITQDDVNHINDFLSQPLRAA